jgi:hypothetical protein
MPVTLAQAKLNVQDDLQAGVIDEFAKSSFLFNNLTFDDCVSPTGGGATLTYGYTRLITQPTAAFRAVNQEYQAQEVNKQRFTTDLKVFGGSFQVDRVISNLGGIISEVSLQMQQKIKAAAALFNHTVINGDNGVNPNEFDGLDKALVGSSTEMIPAAPLVLDTSTNVTANWQAFLDLLDEFLMSLDGTPSFIGGNTKLIAKIRAVARRAGMYQVTKNDFGQQIEQYGNIPLVDFGAQPGSNNPVVPINVGTGETSLYAARLGLDGFHAVSMAGVPPVQSWLPDYKTAGAVKTGEVEMVAAVVLKATKAAGVLRRIKVQ